MKTLLSSCLLVCFLVPLCACVHASVAAGNPPTTPPSPRQVVHDGPGCSTVFDCAQAAVQAAQNASAAADRAASSVPVGTVIAFSGTAEQARAQRQNGWWVADGSTVTDATSAAYFGKPVPDLTNKFLLAAASAGTLGGDTKVTVPPQTISSHTTGTFGLPQVNGDPVTHMQGPHTFNTDNSIYSQGDYNGVQNLGLPLPPYYTVIYLIKVR